MTETKSLFPIISTSAYIQIGTFSLPFLKSSPMSEKVHLGYNIRRLREMMGMKQQALAIEIGMSQQGMSAVEAREHINDDLLNQIAKAMKVTPEDIKNFDPERTTINIQHNHENSNNKGNIEGNSIGRDLLKDCTVNPMEEWVKALEEIRKLSEENRALYERLLAGEKEKLELLNRFYTK
jgi:transcriptional regulator with XRE-family HTH domain